MPSRWQLHTSSPPGSDQKQLQEVPYSAPFVPSLCGYCYHIHHSALQYFSEILIWIAACYILQVSPLMYALSQWIFSSSRGFSPPWKVRPVSALLFSDRQNLNLSDSPPKQNLNPLPPFSVQVISDSTGLSG